MFSEPTRAAALKEPVGGVEGCSAGAKEEEEIPLLLPPPPPLSPTFSLLNPPGIS